MTLPNFLIIGAEKAGTTSLYNYLKEHPEIFMSEEKEPFFFICEGGHPEILGKKIEDDNFLKTRITIFREYEKLFKGVKDEKAIGEASASYLYVPDAAKRIKNYIPDVKLIAILRHPVDRAYSNFLHCIGRGVEPLKVFEEVIKEEEKRMKENWGLVYYYKEKGFYYKYLKTYFELFHPSQIKVFLYEDFESNSKGILKEIFQFLGVDETFTPKLNEKYNISKKQGLKSNPLTGLLRSRNPIKLFIKDLIPQSVREKMVTVIDKVNSENISSLSEETRNTLINDYKADILNLQSLINKDLSHWL